MFGPWFSYPDAGFGLLSAFMLCVALIRKTVAWKRAKTLANDEIKHAQTSIENELQELRAKLNALGEDRKDV